MPRIPPQLLDNVVYLYPSVDAADSGSDFGGTGFLVHIPSPIALMGHTYVVTNWHVAVSGGHSVIRLNTIDGELDVIEAEPHDWEFIPDLDLAVLPVVLTRRTHRVAFVTPDNFVTQQIIFEQRIGPGEDIFMVGRFIDHDGGFLNQPSVRFGNISVMPTPIKHINKKFVDSYCIDMHSRSSYSGSPVYMFRAPGFDLEKRLPTDRRSADILLDGANFLGLLGIHFAQFPEAWEIALGAQPESESRTPLIREGMYVKGLSGMTCVLPAWRIMDVLNKPKLKEQREQLEREWATMPRPSAPTP